MSSPSSTGSVPESNEAYVSLALDLAHRAGRVMLRSWRIHPNDRPSFNTKSSVADVVTETDAACERLIQSGIQSVYPHHRFLGEEGHSESGSTNADGSYGLPKAEDATSASGSADASSKPIVSWICDPLDGTNNFVHQLPCVSVSIGVVVGREIVAAVVHHPVFAYTCFAIKGGGSWRVPVDMDSTPHTSDDERASTDSAASLISNALSSFATLRTRATPLRVSSVSTLRRACVATEMGYAREKPIAALMLSKLASLLASSVQSVRMSGSCCYDMCCVAEGRMEAYYEGTSTEVGPKPWDVAAAALIIAEAGGCVTDLDGSTFDMTCGRVLAAANADILREMIEAIKQANEEWKDKYPNDAQQLEEQQRRHAKNSSNNKEGGNGSSTIAKL